MIVIPSNDFPHHLHFRFDFATNEWTQIAPMSVPRLRAARAVLANRLFIIGGRDDRATCLHSVECYDPAISEWKTVAPMRRARANTAACAVNGSIYVFGGHDAEGGLSSIERYDPDGNTWTEASVFNLTRYDMSDRSEF